MSSRDDAEQKESPDQGFAYSDIPFISKGESYVSFTVRLDKAVYFNTPEPDPPARLIASLIFRATVIPPVILQYNTSQRFDLDIINDSKTVVYRWSTGRVFRMMASVGPVVGEKIWKVEVVLADSNGKSLPAGRYIAKAFLTTAVHGTTATVGFLISNQIPPIEP